VADPAAPSMAATPLVADERVDERQQTSELEASGLTVAPATAVAPRVPQYRSSQPSYASSPAGSEAGSTTAVPDNCSPRQQRGMCGGGSSDRQFEFEDAAALWLGGV